jgi:Zn-dependent peptidase ImmA (M78 family)
MLLEIVDNNHFSDNRHQNRLRFSFAHEIGHFILHKDIYKSFGIKNIKDFEKLINDIPSNQYGYLEIQANKFASFLLAPREKLITERDKEIKKVGNLIASGKIKNRKEINSYLAVPISKVFGVSEEVIEIALNELSD